METNEYIDDQGNQVTEFVNDDGEVIRRTVVANGSTVGIVAGAVEGCSVNINRR